MSVDFNTPIEKLLHKTRSFLRDEKGNETKDTITRNVKMDDYTLNVKLFKGGRTTIKVKSGKFEVQATLYAGGKVEYTGHYKTNHRLGEMSPSMPIRDRAIHYMLRTYLKKGIPGWQSHRAPLKREKSAVMKRPRGW